MRAVSDSVWWVSAAVGYLQVNSENSVGYCVPTNGSVDEVIAGLARASASAAAGVSGDHTVAIAVGSPLAARLDSMAPIVKQ